MSDKIKAVIFDWNGVIVNDARKVYNALMYVFDYYGYSDKKISFEEFRDEYILPWPDFYTKMGLDIKESELKSGVFISYFKTLPKADIFPDVLETLNWLKEKGIVLDILSSHKQELLELEMKQNNLENYFNNVYSAVINKTEKIHEVVDAINHNPKHVLYVGDMCHDVETAKHVGVRSAVVTCGYNSKKTLMKSKPDFVLEKLSDLKKLDLF